MLLTGYVVDMLIGKLIRSTRYAAKRAKILYQELLPLAMAGIRLLWL